MRSIKQLRGIVLAVIAANIFFVFSAHAAAGDLEVIFESQPLFSEANFLPGGETARFIKVKNNTSDSKNIIIEAINKSDPDGFASQLTLDIKEGLTSRYSDTLENFFAAGEVALSFLAGNGAQTQYDVTIGFTSASDNTYQGKTLGFDLLVGFEGAEDIPSEAGSNAISTDSNGGGGGGIAGLSIANESTNVADETGVTISWFTSYKSTSRVIYGTVSGVFDFAAQPNYGYPFSSAEFDTPANPNGVTFHQVALSGLTPGTTYYYRTISHASPDTISYERSFTTTHQQIVSVPQGAKGTPAQGLIPASNQGISLATKDSFNTTTNTISAAPSSQNQPQTNGKASGEEQSTPSVTPTISPTILPFAPPSVGSTVNGLGAFLANIAFPFWWWYILAIFLVIFILYRFFRDKEK